jgi:hypothetical protein
MDPSTLATASSDRTGVGCKAETAPEDKEGGRIVYISFPVFRFQISTLPSLFPTMILFRYVGMLVIPPDKAPPPFRPLELGGISVV